MFRVTEKAIHSVSQLVAFPSFLHIYFSKNLVDMVDPVRHASPVGRKLIVIAKHQLNQKQCFVQNLQLMTLRLFLGLSGNCYGLMVAGRSHKLNIRTEKQ
jgi:hypothetical protein